MLFPDALPESAAALGDALAIMTDIRKVSGLVTEIWTDEHAHTAVDYRKTNS